MSSGGHQLPKRIFPVPYQVDFSVESKGRHLDSTKRKLIWKFGFAHPPSVFPHLFDKDENYMGDITNDGSIIPYPDNPKKGVECRGREHEIILTWSLLTGKAHIYVDSREIYRHAPLKDEVFNPFSAQFHQGFQLPNPKFNGKHQIDIRCYARTPIGAKNMVVNESGDKFRQYDLTVDGLSFFNFPAVYELGTERMWAKVSRWGMVRQQTMEEETYKGEHERSHHHEKTSSGTSGRMVDEYYFDKAQQRKSKSDRSRYGQEIGKSEYKAMNPKTESEEEYMMRIATEASIKDWQNDYAIHSSSSEENDRSFANASRKNHGEYRNNSNRPPSAAKKSSTPNRMASIGEDNLIDFGTVDDAARAVSQITISRETTSDVSVLGDDDDKTTASFMLNTAWGSNGAAAPPQQQPPPAMMSPGMQIPSPANMYANQQPQYQDPTFARQQYSQQPWSSVGTVSSTTPRSGYGGLPSSDASFAVPPPPTLDDYKNAFGGSTMSVYGNGGASVMGGSTVMVNTNMMPPASPASVGMASPMTQQMQQQPQMAGTAQYGMPLHSSPAPPVAKSNKFDPFAS